MGKPPSGVYVSRGSWTANPSIFTHCNHILWIAIRLLVLTTHLANFQGPMLEEATPEHHLSRSVA